MVRKGSRVRVSFRASGFRSLCHSRNARREAGLRCFLPFADRPPGVAPTALFEAISGFVAQTMASGGDRDAGELLPGPADQPVEVGAMLAIGPLLGSPQRVRCGFRQRGAHRGRGEGRCGSSPPRN